METNSTSFWIIGAIWFSVPILSWLWSLASIYYYKKLKAIITEATAALEQSKKLNEQTLTYRLETLEMRTKVEEEIKQAATYYSKISDLIANKNPLKVADEDEIL